MVPLTKRRREILQALAGGDDLAYSPGGGWWVGNDRTNGATAMWLLRHCLVSEADSDSTMERYEINESGQRVLAGEDRPYRLSDGRWVGSMAEALARQPQQETTEGQEQPQQEGTEPCQGRPEASSHTPPRGS